MDKLSTVAERVILTKATERSNMNGGNGGTRGVPHYSQPLMAYVNHPKSLLIWNFIGTEARVYRMPRRRKCASGDFVQGIDLWDFFLWL